MDPELYSTRNKGLTLAQLMDIIEEDDLVSPDVFILPPENGNETEVDSDDSDDEHVGNVNHLPRGILSQPCEMVQYDNDDNDNDEYEAEDLLTLAELRRCMKANETKESYEKSKWKQNPTVIPDNGICKECDPRQPSTDSRNAETPVDYFKLFFDMELLTTIIEQSNKYALQKNDSLDLSLNELYVFLGILLLSGYGKYPNRRILWSSEDDVPKIVQNSMRLKRFEKILKYIHFSDNATLVREDRLYKIRPLIEKLTKNFRQHGGLQEHLSIDESMVPYYGKHYAKQYIRGKPIRFGFKNWALCTNEGYMVGFDIYTGKNTSMEKRFGIGGDVVLALLQQVEVPKNGGYKIYFDNYFTSLPLLAHLSENKYCATGTIRENRLEQCPVPTKKSWNKENRGSYKFYANQHSTLLVQWKDNKVVCIVSNFEDNSIGSVSRWDRVAKVRKNLPQPKVVAGYNKGMGGVDKLDALVAAYRTRIRQRKWYWPLVVYLLDVSVVNGWLLAKRLQPDNKSAESLLSFRRYMALSFLKSFGIKPHQGRVSMPVTEVRFDNTGHMIVYNNTDRRCKHCGKKSQFVCEKCNIALHPKQCFKDFHSK